ncbi:MAG: MBL fold metallo-hydrolase, partial [Promethearchaeia archaeon]
MVFIKEEGKFSENSYLIDGLIFRLPKQLALYIIENGGKKVLIDAGVKLAIRKVFNKMKEFGLTPIDEIILTHSHWDHIQGFNRMKKLNGAEIKVYASENAIERLKNPEKMNDIFGYDTEPIENVNPLKEGDII